MRILSVNHSDAGGGAERVALNLLRSFRAAGHDAFLAVGRQRSAEPHILRIRHEDAGASWSRWWWKRHVAVQPLYARGALGRWLCRAAHTLAQPLSALDAWAGREDFRYPGSARIADLLAQPPDVLHFHNLHVRYFDLRALPALAAQFPVFLTLHDAWLLTGHCAHPLECTRWKTGCGQCPHLDTYPAVRRDATAFNWQRKREIFAACRLHVAAPSHWLMSAVRDSILWPAVRAARVIHNGIDTDVFRPATRRDARAALGLPLDADILLFAANRTRTNAFKDFATLRRAIQHLVSWRGHAPASRPLLLLALGEAAPPERLGTALIRYLPFEPDPQRIARFCQAADLYLHAARADTFPTSILESLACGTPVVATAVGGIPEQIRPHDFAREGQAADSTGVLVPPADDEAIARAVESLLARPRLLSAMGQRAAADARRRFSLADQTARYLEWFAECTALPARTATADAGALATQSPPAAVGQPVSALSTCDVPPTVPSGS
ncbi:MAG: D-inositol-3-phosphate glycosyltransferase [Phycisphaerae bacterium]|nr:D-inositol-3-phosphate glycosyltransferase [Phycisphaerae bacterium]